MMKRTHWHKVLYLLALAAVFIALWMVFCYAPMEMSMGMVQKVFFFHVAFAWIGMLSFLVAAAASVSFLSKRILFWDFLTESSIEIGLVFTLTAVISGSIWAKPIWNTWWTWDPRLTTTSIMALIYFGYLFLRKALDNKDSMRGFSALYCIAGFITVPMTFFSIRNSRSIHPVVIGTGSSGMNMTPEMFAAMVAAIIALTVLYAALLVDRIRLARLNELSESDDYLSEQDYE